MGSLTTDLLAILDDLSQPVRVAWAVWFVWAVVQTVWYWRSRAQDPVYRTAVPRTRSASRIAVASRSASRIAVASHSASSGSRPVPSSSPETEPGVDSHIGGTPEFLAALGLKKRTPATTTDEDTASVYR
jgi:hypothetical protein